MSHDFTSYHRNSLHSPPFAVLEASQPSLASSNPQVSEQRRPFDGPRAESSGSRQLITLFARGVCFLVWALAAGNLYAAVWQGAGEAI